MDETYEWIRFRCNVCKRITKKFKPKNPLDRPTSCLKCGCNEDQNNWTYIEGKK